MIVLLLENPSKGNNLGPILRCASASGVRQILTVGYDKCAVQGSHGADKHVQLTAFGTAAQAVAALRQDKDDNDDDAGGSALVIGLLGALPDGYRDEGYPVVCQRLQDDDDDHKRDNHHADKHLFIPLLEAPSDDGASTMSPPHLGTSYPIHILSAFNNNPLVASILSAKTLCLVISKDHLGLPVSLAATCQMFVHVPCVRIHEGNPFLDCPSTLTIALHRIAQVLGHDEASFRGHKFQVIKPVVAMAKSQSQRQEEREKKLREAALESDSSPALLGLSLWKVDDVVDGDY